MLTNSSVFILRESPAFRDQWVLGVHQGMAFQGRRYKQYSYCANGCMICDIASNYQCSRFAVIKIFHTHTQGDRGIPGDRGKKGDKGDYGEPGSTGLMVI